MKNYQKGNRVKIIFFLIFHNIDPKTLTSVHAMHSSVFHALHGIFFDRFRRIESKHPLTQENILLSIIQFSSYASLWLARKNRRICIVAASCENGVGEVAFIAITAFNMLRHHWRLLWACECELRWNELHSVLTYSPPILILVIRNSGANIPEFWVLLHGANVNSLLATFSVKHDEYQD